MTKPRIRYVDPWKLRLAREAMDYTQAGLAEAIGLSRVGGAVTVSRWETFDALIPKHKLSVLAKVLRLSTDELLSTPEQYRQGKAAWRKFCASGKKHASVYLLELSCAE